MTNKEAIIQLTERTNIYGFTDEDNEALDLAIKALEQTEIKGDLISREALKKAIDNAYKEYDGYDPNDLVRFAERVDEEIDNAPIVKEINNVS